MLSLHTFGGLISDLEYRLRLGNDRKAPVAILTAEFYIGLSEAMSDWHVEEKASTS